jgi:hypothetical protein
MACTALMIAGLQKDNEALLDENRRLRESLRYISDHHWVAGATPVKWINEFVDVANDAF